MTLRSIARIGLVFATFATATCGTATKAAAAWPDRPLRLIVAFTAGSSSDIIARVVAAKMADRLGQQIVVENRVGGSTIIGTDAVAKSAPDGYTLGLANTTTHAASSALTPNLPFDPVKDFAPVAMIGSSPFVLIASPTVPANTLQEFVALAKEKPGTLNYASAGVATLAHLAGELFKSKAGIEVTHVSYRGTSQSMVDLMAGRIDLMVATIPPTLEHIRTHKLKALATMSDARNEMLPEIPTVAQAGVPGAEAGLWTAIVVPAGVPADIIRKLNEAVIAAVNDPDAANALKKQGVDLNPGPPEAVAKRIREDVTKWSAIVASAKIVPNSN